MRPIAKGLPGHLNSQKKAELIRTLLLLLFIAILFTTGYIATGSRKNWFTLFAVLSCLPMARYAVNFIVRIPYPSLDKNTVRDLKTAGESVYLLFDLVFTTQDHNYCIPSLALQGSSVVGYAGDSKTDPAMAQNYLRDYLKKCGYSDASVKIFPDLQHYRKRVVELNALDKDKTDVEKKIAASLVSISL